VISVTSCAKSVSVSSVASCEEVARLFNYKEQRRKTKWLRKQTKFNDQFFPSQIGRTLGW
jgi:hypothetical protein